MKIIDVGACVGLYIDLSFEDYGEKIEKIYAFEPFQLNYEHLVEKYKDNDKVELFKYAISNYNGKSNFYKKQCTVTGKIDFVGNAGSSLKSDKSNVTNQYNEVEVISLSSFLTKNNILDEKFDIIKIDTEGSEYDILSDIIDNNLYNNFDKILFEDHCRKVPSIINDKDNFINKIKELDIESKFFIQDHNVDHTKYIPITSWSEYK